MRRVRYQFGSLKLVKGAKQDVWTFRFYERGSEGKRHYKRIRIGTKQQYPTEAAALKALEGLRLSVNSGTFQVETPSLGGVIDRYLREELPERFSTRVSYNSLLKKWIKPKWEMFRSIKFARWKSSIG